MNASGKATTGCATVGFNVISYVSGNLGIGVTARNVVRVLVEHGCPVSVLDLDPGLGRKGYDHSFDHLTVASLEGLSHPINLIVLPPASISELLPTILAQKPGSMNVGFCMWELPVLPDAWVPAMQALDALVAESEFIRYAFEFNLSDVLTIPAAHPIYLPDGVRADRARFGLPDDGVVFFTGFEPVSDPQRKNPFATVRAFLAALGDDPRAHLVIKFNNATVNGQMHPIVRELQELCGGHPRIRFLTETLSYADVLSLYASCDVFVSLHRSEGLGLGPMEAMALGRPAIATAWSGNMSYMDHTNACLVGYRLVPVDGSIAHYSRKELGKDTVWAEPSIDEAAAWMRRLADDPGLRTSMGTKAAADIARYHATAQRGRWIDELYRIYDQLHYVGQDAGDGSDGVRRAVRQHRSDKLSGYLIARRVRESTVARAQAYRAWIPAHVPTNADLARLRGASREAGKTTLVHLVVRARAGTEERLAETLDSIGAQTGTNWRLTVIADIDAPPGALGPDERIAWRVVSDATSDNETLNSAALETPGDWVALMESGDRLAAHAVDVLTAAVQRYPHWRVVYVDDDLLCETLQRVEPRFKPDFDLERLRAQHYPGEFLLVERSQLRAIGGYVGAPEVRSYDLILRAVDLGGEACIGHVADVLFHRLGANDHGRDQVRAHALRRQALAQHFVRRAIAADIEFGVHPGSLSVNYRHAGVAPRVSIVIPTRDRIDLIQPCVTTLLAQTRYPDYEVLIVDNASSDPATLAFFDEIRKSDRRVRVLRYPQEFNYAAINNVAAREASGDYLLLLNNDTLIVQPAWLELMMAQARREEVGAVGARLIFPDRRLQHAGIIVGMGTDGVANHAHYGLTMEDEGYLGRAQVAQEVSAVTGACLLVRKTLYEEVGGMDAERLRILYNDVDLCLKIRAKGRKIVWTPHATVVHFGSVSVGPRSADPAIVAQYHREVATMHERWAAQLANDRYFNRNLSLMHLDCVPDADIDTRYHIELVEAPRVLAMGMSSRGAWEHRVRIPTQALDDAGLAQANVVPYFGNRVRVPSVSELRRLNCGTLLLHNTVHDNYIDALKRYRVSNDVFIVFGQDDLMTNLPSKNPFSQTIYKDMKKRLRSALAHCDRLVVTTVPLAEAFRDMIEDIRIVPNYLRRDTWASLTSRRRQGRKPRVGWAGAQQHEGDLEVLHEVVQAMAGEVEWVFMGMCPEPIRQYVAEFHPGVGFAEYPEVLAALNLDLALAPLEHHPFNEAKSNLRLLEYGALGWPVIASDILPYRDAPVARVANHARAWTNAIRERINDLDACAKEGETLREWVRSHWILEDHLDEWTQALNLATSGHGAVEGRSRQTAGALR